MRLILLLALLAGGGWFAPQVMERVDGPCPALEHRAAAVLEAEAAKLPAGDARVARARAVLAGMVGAARGGMAEAMVRERFPQLPPGAGCVVGWWKLVADPDIGAVLAR